MIKIISLNIEGDNHFARWIPWVCLEQPQVVCLQEVFETDIPHIVKQLGMNNYLFSPMLKVGENPYNLTAKGESGILVLSNLESSKFSQAYYVGSADTLWLNQPNAASRVLSWVTGIHHTHSYTVATTHFTWSAKGQVTQEQQRDFQVFTKLVSQIDEVILCGDFNTPRGSSIWDALAETYHDCIPPQEITSLDVVLHRVGSRLPYLVVDGCFISSPPLQLVSCRYVSGVSDHKAIIAQIKR